MAISQLSIPTPALGTTVSMRRRHPTRAIAASQASLEAAKIAPMKDRLLIKLDTAEEKTSGGVLLTGSAANERGSVGVGEIISVGSEVETRSLKVGVKVLFPSYSGTEVKLSSSPDKSGKLYFVNSSDILATLSE